MLCAAIACGIPAERLAALVDMADGDAFAKHCSRKVYPRTGVKCLPDLVSRVMRFRLSSSWIDCPSSGASASRGTG